MPNEHRASTKRTRHPKVSSVPAGAHPRRPRATQKASPLDVEEEFATEGRRVGEKRRLVGSPATECLCSVRRLSTGFQIPVGTRPRVACVRRLRHLDPSLVLLRLFDPPTLDFGSRDARARRPHARRRTSLLDVEKGIATEGQRVGEETSGRLAHHPGFADSPPPETGFQNLQGTHDSAARPLCLGASVVKQAVRPLGTSTPLFPMLARK